MPANRRTSTWFFPGEVCATHGVAFIAIWQLSSCFTRQQARLRESCTFSWLHKQMRVCGSCKQVSRIKLSSYPTSLHRFPPRIKNASISYSRCKGLPYSCSDPEKTLPYTMYWSVETHAPARTTSFARFRFNNRVNADCNTRSLCAHHLTHERRAAILAGRFAKHTSRRSGHTGLMHQTPAPAHHIVAEQIHPHKTVIRTLMT